MIRNDLDIKYGMFNLREERELARASFEYIATDIKDIQQSYIRLGFHLIEAKCCGYHEDFGYDKFEDFVAANFGLGKSALSRCMNVYSRFFMDERNKPVVLPDKRIKYKYEEYSYSQLCEMLSLKDEQLKEIKPDMTIKQIRDFKKSISKSAPVPVGKNKENPSIEFSFIELFVEHEKPRIQSLINVCKREKNNKERAKEIQKILAPYGCHGVHCSDFSYEFLGFSYGIDFSIGLQKGYMSYIDFVKLFMEFMSILKSDDEGKQVATSQPKKKKDNNLKEYYVSFDNRLFIIDLLNQCVDFIKKTGLSFHDLYFKNNSCGFEDEEDNEYVISISKRKPKKKD